MHFYTKTSFKVKYISILQHVKREVPIKLSQYLYPIKTLFSKLISDYFSIPPLVFNKFSSPYKLDFFTLTTITCKATLLLSLTRVFEKLRQVQISSAAILEMNGHFLDIDGFRLQVRNSSKQTSSICK
jgi:hypothetical protein